jgi:hypothetical protein
MIIREEENSNSNKKSKDKLSRIIIEQTSNAKFAKIFHQNALI